MSSFVSDCLYAFRIFYKRPGLTLLSILALAISLGLSTTTFSVLNGMFLKPLPFEKPEQLYFISLHNTKSDITMLPIPKGQLDSLQQADAFTDLTGFYSGTINLSGDGRPERYNGAFVTPNFLDVLGQQPILGRSFSPDAGTPGGPEEVLLSRKVWETRFKGDPDVIGTIVRANGRPHQIIGVLPDGFHFPMQALVWVPVRMDPPTGTGTESTHVEVLGRARPGTSPDLIQKQLDDVYRGWGSDSVEEKETLRLTSTRFGPFNWNDASQSLVLVMICAVIFILLISCANVANLLVGRALSRGREMAIRSALGATRKRILRQLLTESLVLSLCGSVGGLLYAAWAVDTSLRSSIWEIPYWMNFELDWRVFLFAFMIMLATTLISGFVPAWQSSKIDLNEMLKDTSHTSTSFRLGRLTRLLAVIQIAFSCALLFGAGLVTRNVLQMKNLQPGFEAGEVLTMRMGLFPEDYPEESDRDSFYSA
jgi:putative ABC transport system permease protein